MAIVKMKKLHVIAMADRREELLKGLLHLGCVEISQPSEELAVAALLVAAVYLLCCFLRVEWVPAEQKGRQEPEES